jgi:NitT/TauT family transport system substrate-binding protein
MRPIPGLRAVVLLLSLTTSIIGGSPGTTGAADNIVLVLNAPPSGIHAGIIYAQQKGFFTKAGLIATIERGKGSGYAVRNIVKRQMTFALGELAAVIESRAEGIDTVGLSLLMERFPAALLALKGSGLTQPADFEGKKLAAPPSSFARILFPAFAERARIDLEKVRWAKNGPNLGVETLLSGRAVGVATAETVRWRYQEGAKKKEKDIISFPYSDWGVNVYGLSLLAPARLIQEEENIVRRMVNAVVGGVGEAMMNPAEALRIFRQTFPNHSADGAEAEWKVFLKSWSPEGLKEPGFGFYEESRVRRLQTLLVRGRHLTREFPPDIYFTNRFIPKMSVQPPSF